MSSRIEHPDVNQAPPSTTPEDVARVAALLPDLSRFGFGFAASLPSDPDFLGQVDAARAWLRTSPLSVVLLSRLGSYAAKHRAEQRMRHYVSVGALVTAAALSGVTPVRTSKGPNCRFAIGGMRHA